MIHIAIVEDDQNCAVETKQYIEDFSKETGQKFRISHFSDGIKFLTDYHSIYDIVFMDIDMPNLNGMDTARKLREIDPVIVLIFLTNMAQYAIKGYEVNAIDYIVKPVGYFNFSLKLKKALKFVEFQSDISVLVPQTDGVMRIKSTEIQYIEVVDHNLIYYSDNQNYEARGSLKDLEKKLIDSGFAKCNHCYLVNLNYVTGISGNFVKMLSGANLQLSRPKRKKFLDQLAAYRNGGGSLINDCN